MTELIMDHDMICAQEVNQMYNLGCFAEQFVTYATCCLLNQTSYYFVSDRAENAYGFCQSKLQVDIFCLPDRKQTQSALVPSGHREDLSQQFKRQAALALVQDGASETARLLANLAKPAVNSAEGILSQLQRRLTGCFAEDSLQIFAGLVELSYAARKITALTYWKYRQWLGSVTADWADKRIVHDVHERVYTGIGYLNADGSLGYYYNAVEAMTLERQCLLRCQKQLVTPLFRKRYCFHDIDQLSEIALDFQRVLRRCYSLSYFAICQQIYQLPGVVEQPDFLAVYAEQQAKGRALAVQALNYYGTLWTVW